MADKLLIVHGYSDGATSFTALRDYFVRKGAYAREHIYFVDYASMDDAATFRDFADKLDQDRALIAPGGEPIDVACHSTGALVTRAWLALHWERHRQRGIKPDCPVAHLLMFAPANFGSDLAGMGQSFLGKIRATFFNSHSHGADFLESGKQILQGLEPASPFQWELAHFDLHGGGGYFNPRAPAARRCYPFVFAAANSYTGLETYIVSKRKKPGTDGVVRICGTSLNTRKLRICFFDDRKSEAGWEKESKYPDIPFAAFDGFRHGNIVDAEGDEFDRPDGPGPLALEALNVNDMPAYRALGKRFKKVMQDNYRGMPKAYRDKYQQFFFRVRDDVDLPVDDYFLDFKAVDTQGNEIAELTEIFDKEFAATFKPHSADRSCRAMLLNCTRLRAFLNKLRKARARLVFDITARSHVPNVAFQSANYTVLDGAGGDETPGPRFLYPNTTTLVDIVLNRTQAKKLLNISDAGLNDLSG